MTRRLAAIVSAGVVGLAAQTGLAQRTLQWDINNLSFQARDANGLPIPFGGLTHTGQVTLVDTLPMTELVEIGIRSAPGQPFAPQGGAPWNLTDVSMTVNLNAGMVTGGTFSIDINGGPVGGGDRYTATIGSAGTITPFVGGGFKIEGLTSNGNFSDAAFGTVNVADFFAAQTSPPGLMGSFLGFRINPNSSGAGTADVDAFVSPVPSPGTMACLGAAGLLFAPRRRKR
jgi:hypothetical protein